MGSSRNLKFYLFISQIAQYEVDENAPIHDLVFEAGKTYTRQNDFQLTNISCYICEENFDTNDDYEKHVEYHSDDSDFASLNDMNTRYAENHIYFNP